MRKNRSRTTVDCLAKSPLKPKETRSLRIRQQLAEKARYLALFNLAIDSKLRGCDLVALRVRDCTKALWSSRAIIIHRKAQRPVRFEVTEAPRDSIAVWVARCDLRSTSYLFPGRGDERHPSVRQYSRIVKAWAGLSGTGMARIHFGVQRRH